jgi:hypothetical protein
MTGLQRVRSLQQAVTVSLEQPMSADSSMTRMTDAPSYEAALPLQWQALEAAPDPLTLERLGDDNLRVLSAVVTLSEQRGASATSGDETTAVDVEIARLHQKLNLLVDLVALLVSQQAPQPPARSVRVSWLGLRWSDPEAKGLGLVQLRLHSGVPQPFVWPARIESRDGDSINARFEPMPEACQAALERYVFLQHRRAIAGQRRPGGS